MAYENATIFGAFVSSARVADYCSLLVTMVFCIPLCTRRMHDVGLSGWWLIGVPLLLPASWVVEREGIIMPGAQAGDPNALLNAANLGWIVWPVTLIPPFVMLFIRGQSGDNRYGANPRNNDDELAPT